MLDTKSLSTNCVASLSPMPSISWNLHQYSKDLTTLAGQLVLPHFRNAPSEKRRLLHLGHSLGTTTADFVGRGSSNGRPSECNRPNTSSGEALPITPIIFGMTSPRLTIFTKSPILMPNLCTSPGLWRVVFSTVTPDTTTGATLATGVTLPVRPVCQSTPITTVVASSGGNFQASAHLGWCAVWPSMGLFPSSSTLMTRPSISQGTFCRFSVASLVV